MALPTGDLTFPENPAPFLPPRDRPKLTWEDWTLGGVGLNDASQGLDGWTWRFAVDPSTGVVSIERDGEVVDASWFTIPGTDPDNGQLVEDFAASFDSNNQPVIGWTMSDGISFYRWFDPTIPAFDTIQLATGSYCVRIVMDDPRVAQNVFRDTIIAYVRDNRLYYRQLRDRFENEYPLTGSGGMIFLYQIGMNELLRMQFSRSGEFVESDKNVKLPRPPFREGPYPLAFDSDGNLIQLDRTNEGLTAIPGPAGKEAYRSATGSTFFVQKHDGTWAGASSTRGEAITFFQPPTTPLGQRTREWTTNAKGELSLSLDEQYSEQLVFYREVNEGPVLTGMYRDRLGHGHTFSVASITEGPTFGEFAPNYAGTGDFANGLAPAGTVEYVDHEAHVTLSVTAAHVGSSVSQALRWPTGTLPPTLRPTAQRTVPCTVTTDTQAVAAGMATFYPDGSASFVPLTADVISDAPVVNYAKFTYNANTASADVLGNGQHRWLAPAAEVDFLIVAGGGRGGRGYRINGSNDRNIGSGGGGSGSVVQALGVALTPGQPYVLQIGRGGRENGTDTQRFNYPGDPLGNSGKNTTGHPSRRGGDSSVVGLGDALRALGGGHGGHANRFPANGEPGFSANLSYFLALNPGNAGCGGGAGCDPGESQIGGSGKGSGGDATEHTNGTCGAGGGGGNAAGSAGDGDTNSGHNGGAGGDGLALSAIGWGDAVSGVSAPPVVGAGGGGAGTFNAAAGLTGTGGAGGSSSTGGDGADSVAVDTAPGASGTDGAADTGSGGGGAVGEGNPGNGADGLILARWISAGATFGLMVPGAFVAGGDKGLPAGFVLTYPK